MVVNLHVRLAYVVIEHQVAHIQLEDYNSFVKKVDLVHNAMSVDQRGPMEVFTEDVIVEKMMLQVHNEIENKTEKMNKVLKLLLHSWFNMKYMKE